MRPTDLALLRTPGVPVLEAEPEPATHTAVGRVRRIARLGAYVKLDLGIASGELVTVHLQRREFEDLAVKA